MTHIALKNFPLSRNGVNIERIIAGDPVEVPDEFVKGLLDEGYIATPESVQATSLSQIKNEPTPVAGDGEPATELVSGEPTPVAGAGENGAVTETKDASKKVAGAKKDGAE